MKSLSIILLLCIASGVVSAEIESPAVEAPAVEAPAVEVLPMLVNLPPLPPPLAPSPPPTILPPPSVKIEQGCPGVSLSLRFSDYTAATFGPTEAEEFCYAVKAATSWFRTTCAVTNVLNYPSPAPGVIVTAYVLFEPLDTDDLAAGLITADYYRDLLLNNLNQTTLLPVIFSALDPASTVEVLNECFVYSAVALGYVCSNKATSCILNRGCFVDSNGNEYLEHLFADTFTCSARSAPSSQASSTGDLALAQNQLLEILSAPTPESAPGPESEGNSTSPSSSPSPILSPIPSPPPVTPVVCSYVGTYRLQPVACPGKYLAVFPSCGKKGVALRSSIQAPGSRIRWNLNTTAVNNIGVPAPITSLRNCRGSSLHLTSPSDTRQPSLGGSSWRFQVIPSGSSCSTINIIANSRLSSAPFLAVSSTCDSFVWSASAGSRAEFKAIRA